MVADPLDFFVVVLADLPHRLFITLHGSRLRIGELRETLNPLVFHLRTGEKLGVSAEEDVGTASGHVGGDGHRVPASGLGDHACLELVVHGVQDVVLDAILLEQLGKPFALLDRHRAYEHRLAALLAILELLDHRSELLGLGAIDDVGIVLPDHLPVRGDHDDLEVVNFLELHRFGVGRARHAGELLVHSEVVLDRNRRQRLVFALDPNGFLGFDGLMETVRPTPAGHEPAGELVDDDHLAVLHDVIDVLLEERVGAQRLIHVVQRVDFARIVEVWNREDALDLGHALVGEKYLAQLLVDRVVRFLLEARDHPVDLVVLVGGFLRRPRNDQRRARLVDEDVVHLVHDREVELSLHVFLERELHVVAQVIEAELVVRTVGDVREIRFLALDRAKALEAVVLDQIFGIVKEACVVDDRCHAETQGVINRSHPLHVTPRQVVVHGDEVRALSPECV